MSVERLKPGDECRECDSGNYQYEGQETSPRGNLSSVVECNECGDRRHL